MLAIVAIVALGACSASAESEEEAPPWEEAILSAAAWGNGSYVHRSSEGVELWLVGVDVARPAVPHGMLTPAAEALLVAQCDVLTQEVIDEAHADACAASDHLAYAVRLEACESRLAGWCPDYHGSDEPWTTVNEFAEALFDQMADCREGEWFVPAEDCEPLDPY